MVMEKRRHLTRLAHPGPFAHPHPLLLMEISPEHDRGNRCFTANPIP
jgi:hypothetical protein